MKTRSYQFKTEFLFAITLLFLSASAFAGSLETENPEDQLTVDTVQYNMHHGIVVDAETNKPLVFANIFVKESNIATITNSDGEFTLKINKRDKANTIVFSHIGYTPVEVSIAKLKEKKNKIELKIQAVPLGEVNIYPYDADFLVRHIMKKVPDNYSQDANKMKGFYRETIKKNRSYVGISEAVVDIYKAGYLDSKNDQIQIFKGRKSEDVSKMDTLVFKLQGGPSTSLMFDVIKSPASLLSPDFIDEYEYSIENIIMIDKKPHYVVAFKQKRGAEYPLYNGKYYIETNTLALTSAEFSLNLEDVKAATNSLIRKKPLGLKVTAKQVNYLVKFCEQQGKWYFNYARGEMVMKFNWKRRLFNTYYTAMMEIAITDRSTESVESFKRSERFKNNQILSEEVAQFGDEDFWGHHNTIEPDESIQSAIDKLKRKGSF